MLAHAAWSGLEALRQELCLRCRCVSGAAALAEPLEQRLQHEPCSRIGRVRAASRAPGDLAPRSARSRGDWQLDGIAVAVVVAARRRRWRRRPTSRRGCGERRRMGSEGQRGVGRGWGVRMGGRVGQGMRASRAALYLHCVNVCTVS